MGPFEDPGLNWDQVPNLGPRTGFEINDIINFSPELVNLSILFPLQFKNWLKGSGEGSTLLCLRPLELINIEVRAIDHFLVSEMT